MRTEIIPKAHHKSDKQKGVRTGKTVGDWIQPMKNVTINYFFKKYI